MAYTTLVDTSTLATLMAAPDRLVIVDCRYSLDDRVWGRREYLNAHIPGAVFADMDDDLAGPKTGTNGRHPLPDPAVLAATLGRLGIGAGAQVVVYDQDIGMYASRLWWLLRWLGHDSVAVLDGGLARWRAEHRATIGGAESRPAVQFVPNQRPEMTVDADQVRERLGGADWRLVDARSPERFRGDVEPVDPVAGHIPGAIDHFYKSDVTPEQVFQPSDVLRRRLQETLGGVPSDRTMCYCGSGVTACHILLALEHAGMPGARLFSGSWSEWVSDPLRPVARGDGS